MLFITWRINNRTFLLALRIVDDGERDRLQIAAQIILAISLFLTATILFILFWKSCTRYLVHTFDLWVQILHTNLYQIEMQWLEHAELPSNT